MYQSIDYTNAAPTVPPISSSTVSTQPVDQSTLPPPSTTIYTSVNLAGQSGQIKNNKTASIVYDSTTTLNSGCIAYETPAADATSLAGTCFFFVHNVPRYRPNFDLELTILRPTGALAVNMSVTLDVLSNLNGAVQRTPYNGTLAVPAAGPVPVSRQIVWTDGSMVTPHVGTRHLMPRFADEPGMEKSVADVQTIRLTLTPRTGQTVGHDISILSLRFTFY
jgi:hypothetical protein